MAAENTPITPKKIAEWRTVAVVITVAAAAWYGSRADIRSITERQDRMESDIREIRSSLEIVYRMDKAIAVIEERSRKDAEKK